MGAGSTKQLPFAAADVREWLIGHSKDDIWGGLTELTRVISVTRKLDKNGCWV